ncbi:uncharacterized protein LOC128534030 [Clarias gariepinus]|uniref:uncharacterized protein LOC128534030 n=1 Tax=Clarias gariepinus TaxID=13013 RepID=UPI00234C4726|nr:uncharacterized protein LOC128534030 [Clarias gariepinus]
MRSLATMQAYSLTQPFGLQTHTQQKTTSSNAFIISPQVQYYIAQQRVARQQQTPQSHGLCQGQASTQTVSSSSNLKSREMPQGLVTDSQLHHKNTASTLSNGQFVSWPAVQHGTPTQNLSHHPQATNRNPVPQTLNGNPQQNGNMPQMPSDAPASWLISAFSNRYSPTQQNNQTYQSVLPQCQPSNGHQRTHIRHQPAVQLQQTDLSVRTVSNQAAQIHNQEQIRLGQENSASYSTYGHFPSQSQRLITHQTGQSPPVYNAYQVQHASQIQHHPLSNRIENTSANYNLVKLNGNMHPNQPYPPSYTSQHLIYQSQSMQQISALGLPQEQVQPQTQLQQRNTVQDSCHQSNPYHTITLASQGNTQPQNLQSNHIVTGLPSSSQRTISTSTATRKVPPPVYTESSVNHSHVTLNNLLMDNTQVPPQRYGINTLATPEQTSSHVTTKASYSQATESASYLNALAILKNNQALQRVTEYQMLAKRTAISTETGQNQLNVPDVQSSESMRSRRLQTNTETKDGHESNTRQPTREMQYIEDTTEALELALALNNLFRQSNKAVAVVPPISQQVLSPENNDPVTSSHDSLLFKINAAKENKNVEEESNASSMPKETTEEFVQLVSVPPPETQKHKLKDGSTVDSQTPNTQSTEVPPCKAGSTTSQSCVCCLDLTSESPEDLNSLQTDKSDGDVLDLSKVQGVTFTVEKFKYLIKIVESALRGSVKEPVVDFEKCLIDLYWAGNREELDKKMHTFPANLCDFLCSVSTKEMETLQFLSHTCLERLERFCHILKHDKVLPTEEFRSSWLNVNGQPADIENLLAEPISEFKLPDYVSLEGFEDLDIYLESEPSTNMNPANTKCQNDNIMTKESADCKSKSKVNKQEDENLEKNQQQEENTNFEQSLHSTETEGILIESESTAECEQVYQDAFENITSPSEGIELLDLSHDSDSSNDSQSIQISLLSSDDAKAIFKECFGSDWQQPSQLCQDVTKVLVTPDKKSFCNSANQIKFTCPHVTDFEGDGENFCPKCWEETPLLDLDLEEALFSPECGSPESSKQSDDEQICSPPGSNSTALSKSSSVTDAPLATVNIDEVTIFESEPNPSDKVVSCSPGSGKSPFKEPHAPVSTESSIFTLPIDKVACETNGSVGPELAKDMSDSQNAKNLVIPEQNKTKRDKVFPPESPPCKKLKVVEIREIPANDLFIDVTTKAISTKKQPSTLGVTLAEDGQHCKDVRKEKVEERKLPIKLKILLRCEQSGKPDPHVNVCSESSRDSANSSTYAVTTSITKPDPTSPNSGQICSSTSGKPDSQVLTKTSRKKVSPPRFPPCKKLKNKNVMSLPSEDDLFTPDIVVKKASSPKSHLHDLLSFLNSTEGEQHSKDKFGKNMERKKPCAVKSQVPNLIYQQKGPAVTLSSEKNREKVDGTTKETGQNKETKQRFALYGYNNNNRSKNIHQHTCNRAKPATAPVYVTVSDTSESSMNYTDMPTAKQKVYSQWSSTFVEPKKKTSSHKKNLKPKKDLTSTTQTLKRILKDREAIRDAQMAKEAGDFVVDHKYKKFKSTIAKKTL